MNRPPRIKEAEEYWERLGNVLVNEDDEIEEEFDGYPPGTNKLEIWFDIEERFNVSVAKDLMGLK